MVQRAVPGAKKNDEEALEAFEELGLDDGVRSPVIGEVSVAYSPPPTGAPPSQDFSKVQIQVRPWLDTMADKHLSITQVENTVHRAINNDPKLRKQLKRALDAGGQEALKTVFAHPLIRISSAALKAWVEEGEES